MAFLRGTGVSLLFELCSASAAGPLLMPLPLQLGVPWFWVLGGWSTLQGIPLSFWGHPFVLPLSGGIHPAATRIPLGTAKNNQRQSKSAALWLAGHFVTLSAWVKGHTSGAPPFCFGATPDSAP